MFGCCGLGKSQLSHAASEFAMSISGGRGKVSTTDIDDEWEIVNADAIPHAASPGSSRVFRAVMSKLPRRFKGALQLAWIHWRKRQFELSGPVLSWSSVDGGRKSKREKLQPTTVTTCSGDAQPATNSTFVLCEDTVVQLEKGFGDKVITIMSPRAGVLHIMTKTKALASRWVELLSAALPLNKRSPHLSIGSSVAEAEPTLPPAQLGDYNANDHFGWECDLCGEKLALSEGECPLCGSLRSPDAGGIAHSVPAGTGGSRDASGQVGGEGVALSPVSQCRRQLSQNTAARVDQAFAKLDRNKDGTIGTKDIRLLINDLALPTEILNLLFELRVHEFLVRSQSLSFLWGGYATHG